MVTMVARTGCIVGVDEFVIGLVIVAIGTSVPVSDEAPILPFVYLCAETLLFLV